MMLSEYQVFEKKRRHIYLDVTYTHIKDRHGTLTPPLFFLWPGVRSAHHLGFLPGVDGVGQGCGAHNPS